MSYTFRVRPYFRRLLCCMAAVTFFMTAYSQQIMISSKGESIVMLPDGSWRMTGPADSTLLNQYIRKNQVIPEVDVSASATVRTEAEERAFMMKQWKEIYNRISNEEKDVQNIFRAATNAKFKAGTKLQNAESNIKLVESDQLAVLHEQYDESVENLKKAKSQQKEIKALIDKARKTNAKPQSISSAKINKFRSDFNLYLLHFKVVGNANTPSAQPAAPPVMAAAPEAAAVQAVPQQNNTTVSEATPEDAKLSYDPKMTDKRPASARPLPYTPKPYVCLFAKDTIESSTGATRLELFPETLFSYTDPDLRQYFKDTDLITCKARLSKTGPYVYLTIEFQIASSHAQSNFGGLAEGSLLRCKLMNGEYVSLYNLKNHNGRIDPYTGNTIFIGQYALGKKELKFLSKTELDKLRIMWNTGFEDYEVYHMDFFIHQIGCLMHAKDKSNKEKSHS